MRILQISALPEVLDLFGLGHHHPPVDPAPAGGMAFTRIDASATAGVDSLLRDLPGEGPVVAHLSGTSRQARAIADELATRGVPFLFSPMIASFPGRMEEAFGRLTGGRSAAMADLMAAAEIAQAARMVVTPDPLTGKRVTKRMERKSGKPPGWVRHLPAPAASGPAARGFAARGLVEPNAGAAPSAGRGNFGNLALAFCDSLSPEWNVLNFLAAMEKINADAVVVAGRTDGPYAGECAKRAESNPRVRMLSFAPGGAAAIAAEVAALTERASVLVDPSTRGLGAGIAAGAAAAGVPAVISRSSAEVPPGENSFAFEPTSWELLNHAITCAFNRAAGLHDAAGAQAAGGELDGSARNREVAARLEGLYREAADVKQGM